MGSLNVCLERKGRGGCRTKPVLGICLVEATRCVVTVECGNSEVWGQWRCF